MDISAKYTATIKLSTQNIVGKFGFMDPSVYKIHLVFLNQFEDAMSECIWEEIELGCIHEGTCIKVDYTVSLIDIPEETVFKGTKYVKVSTVVHTNEPSGFIKWKDPNDGIIVEVRPPHIFKVDREKSRWYFYEYMNGESEDEII